MGKKSLASTTVGVLGGIIFGYALGYHASIIQFVKSIPTLAQEIAISISPQYSQIGELLGRGISQALEEYIYENIFNPIPFYILGLIVIATGIILAYKTGETSWLPWRRSKENEK